MIKISGILILVLMLALSGCQILPFQNLPVGSTAATGVTGTVPEQTSAPEELSTPAEASAPAETSGPPEEDSNQPSEPGQADDVTEEIIASMLALSEQESFRTEQTITAPNVNMVNEIEIVPPDRYRLVNSEMEMIIIEENAYIQVAGLWMSVPGSVETIIGAYVFLQDQADAELFRSYVSGATYLGEEDLEGETTHLYEYALSDLSESGAAAMRLWVAVSDGLPRRQEMILSEYKGVSGEASIVNLYKDFNQPITIEAPDE